MAIAVPRTTRFVRGESDDQLVARVRGGEQHAFEAIYDRYSRPLLSFCRHMLGDLQEAEDAVQHTFLSAHRALLADARDIHLKAWLFAIARNRCLSVLRARRDHVGLEDEFEPASTAGLAAEVERREDLREMLDDLARLPDDQREALLLSELRAHSHDEIAEVLGVKRDKVKALVFQAREGLGALRAARMTPCADIREQLATARGGALRRGPLRRHLETCEGCREFRDEVSRQRAALAVVLPVVPSLALKQGVIAATLGGGGGGAAAAAGMAGSSAVVGAAGVGAAGTGAAAGLKAILGKVLITSAVAAGAGGTAVVGVREIHEAPPPAAQAANVRSVTPTQQSTPLPVAHKAKARRALPAAPAPRRQTAARPHKRTAGHHKPATVDQGADATMLPISEPAPSAPDPAPAPAATPVAANPPAPAEEQKGPKKPKRDRKDKRMPPGLAKKEQEAEMPPPQAVAPPAPTEPEQGKKGRGPKSNKSNNGNKGHGSQPKMQAPPPAPVSQPSPQPSPQPQPSLLGDGHGHGHNSHGGRDG